jgi:hypothetical protein
MAKRHDSKVPPSEQPAHGDDEYHAFLAKKTQLGINAGFQPIEIPSFLFPFQQFAVDWAIRKGRALLAEACGLGKSPQQLVWADNVARHTNKPVLIIAPLGVTHQTEREAKKFGIEAKVSRDGTVYKPITITNYERLHYFNPGDFGGAVSDESQGIKAFTGKRRKQVVRFFAKLPYRLLCSATPSPNDFIELGTQSECLGIMTQSDMLGYFFREAKYMRHTVFREGDFWNATKWHFKPHSEQPFWKWVASWTLALQKPSDLGFSDEGFELPPLEYEQHIVETRYIPPGELFPRPANTIHEQQAERHVTVPERCEKVAELIHGQPYAIAWCFLNQEGTYLTKIIPGAVEVAGRHSDDYKEGVYNDFAMGNIPVLVTKPKMGCLGMNWQHCGFITTFPTYCYDEETEILTKRGWLTFDQVDIHSKDDEVGTVNPSTLLFEWQRPTSVVWSPYLGDMIHFECQHSFDLLVTPDHRMFVQRCPIRYQANSGEWIFRTASELRDSFKRQEYRLLSAPLGFTGTEMETIEVTPYERAEGKAKDSSNWRGDQRGMNPESWKHGHLNSVPFLSRDQFIRLAGWYLSEGSCTTLYGKMTGHIVISQTNKNPENRAEIIGLLESMGLPVDSKTKDIGVNSMQLARFLVEQFGAGSYNKRIPLWVKDMPQSDLELLRDTMLKGDGGNKGTYYRTVSKQLSDDFMELCLKTGVRGSKRWRVFRTGPYAGSGIWDVNIAWQHTCPTIYVEPKTVSYSGMIGCVSVPNGVVIVRRNGIPAVSGNSYEAFHQLVRRCWRYGRVGTVRVGIVSSPGEAHVIQGLDKKVKQAERMFSSLVKYTHDSTALCGKERHVNPLKLPDWLTGDPSITYALKEMPPPSKPEPKHQRNGQAAAALPPHTKTLELPEWLSSS